jgi:acetoin utilization protein AcuB
MPKIKSVMTAFPYSVMPAMPVKEALELMDSNRIHHLPVREHDKVLGIVSDRDIKLVLQQGAAEPDALTIGEIQHADAYLVDLDERLDNVLLHMASAHLDAAIVTRHGKLVGMFTTTDAQTAFAEFLRDQFRRSGGGDAA